MSGSTQKEPAYDEDSTGDEYDQGKTFFSENLDRILNAMARCYGPVGDAASLRPMACVVPGVACSNEAGRD